MIYDLQRASMWKRISAFLFDAILLSIVAVLFAWLISTAFGYDRLTATLDEAYVRYGEEYGVDFNLSLQEYDALTSEEITNLNAAYTALSGDASAVRAYNMMIQLMLLITSLGILIGFVIMEFFIPLKLGNGQTLGKKIFGLALMQQDGVRINGRLLFIRSILGKYTIETMIPLLILMMIWFGILGLTGTLVLLGTLFLQLGMLLFTRNRYTIHDAMAGTVTVDYASQLIFPDRAAMIAYKEKVHAENAAQQPY